MSNGPFNGMAQSYDQVFTDTEIGRLQREKVWEYLDNVYDFNKGFSVLELNCGTGEDAIRFAQRGCTVTATDISEEMLEIARSKAARSGVEKQVRFQKLDIAAMVAEDLDHKYDLVFSNFGGLNCVPLPKIRSLQSALWHGLRSRGRFVAVIMPAGCMMETFYFMTKLQPGKAFRRGKKSVEWENNNGESHSIYYHSPKRFVDQFGRRFKTEALLPIGYWIPPSYTDPFFQRHPKVLDFLAKMEQTAQHPILAGISDHYLIDLKIKN
jgi:ubiquinone/menaquinone biosynthesis C-methylase UbiE